MPISISIQNIIAPKGKLYVSHCFSVSKVLEAIFRSLFYIPIKGTIISYIYIMFEFTILHGLNTFSISFINSLQFFMSIMFLFFMHFITFFKEMIPSTKCTV